MPDVLPAFDDTFPYSNDLVLYRLKRKWRLGISAGAGPIFPVLCVVPIHASNSRRTLLYLAKQEYPDRGPVILWVGPVMEGTVENLI